MVSATRPSGQRSQPNNSELEQFRTFQFTFAATLVHEVGAHLLITAIDNGRNQTPPEMSASGHVSIEEKEETGEWVYFGESGRWLEKNLYGGTLEFVQDPARDIKTQVSGILTLHEKEELIYDVVWHPLSFRRR